MNNLKDLKKIDTILIATNNPGKFREIKELLPRKIKCFSPKDFNLKEPKETAKTFKGNARLKSTYCAKLAGMIAISDDSGLEVKDLDNQPGIYSARWAGKSKNFNIAIEKVKKLLFKKKLFESKANFTCSISVAFPSGKAFQVVGKVYGQICFPPKGKKGFGYDPIFVADGEKKTFGQLSPRYKNRISHRYKAFEQLKKYFNFN